MYTHQHQPPRVHIPFSQRMTNKGGERKPKWCSFLVPSTPVFPRPIPKGKGNKQKQIVLKVKVSRQNYQVQTTNKQAPPATTKQIIDLLFTSLHVFAFTQRFVRRQSAPHQIRMAGYSPSLLYSPTYYWLPSVSIC